MKTLKTVVLTVFAIGLLTGVRQLKEETVTKETEKQEINQPEVKLIAFLEIVKKARPDGSNG